MIMALFFTNLIKQPFRIQLYKNYHIKNMLITLDVIRWDINLVSYFPHIMIYGCLGLQWSLLLDEPKIRKVINDGS